MCAAGTGPQPRSTYRHGDLRRALIEAGIELARDGGLDAVVLREATRRVGVAPNAAYRHFTDRRALLLAVCAEAQAALAVAMENELAGLARRADRAANARARMHALGAAYLRFAQVEPGLYRAAFSGLLGMELADHPTLAGTAGYTPLQLLCAVLDELVAVGILPAERRAGAEFVVWSSVHGLATLLIDGPLRDLPAEAIAEIERRLLDMVEKGII
jgi:AcrR family transcriptional regulator